MNKRAPVALAGLLGLAFAITVNAAEKTSAQQQVDNLPKPAEMTGKAAKKEKEPAKETASHERDRHEERGDEYIEQKRFEDAIREFDAAISLDPEMEILYVKKGIALYSSGKSSEAVPLMDKAVKLSQRNKVWSWWPLYHKGLALGLSGDIEGAIKSFNRSIKLNPTYENYFGRGVAYAQQNKPEQALADVKTALKHNPDEQQLKTFAAHLETQLETQKTSEAYLKEMAVKKGAQKTDSGLIYFELKKGDGKSPTAQDTVKIHYHGSLPDGKVFDSSVDRGGPIIFRLSKVIPCWTEGLQKMQVGGTARLVCPASIAYGSRGVGSLIKPGSALAFEVELLAIR